MEKRGVSAGNDQREVGNERAHLFCMKYWNNWVTLNLTITFKVNGYWDLRLKTEKVAHTNLIDNSKTVWLWPIIISFLDYCCWLHSLHNLKPCRCFSQLPSHHNSHPNMTIFFGLHYLANYIFLNLIFTNYWWILL